jgi:hypothetical protein
MKPPFLYCSRIQRANIISTGFNSLCLLNFIRSLIHENIFFYKVSNAFATHRKSPLSAAAAAYCCVCASFINPLFK